MANQSEIIFERISDFPGISENALNKGNLEFAIEITANAKALAPVDEGQLRNSIQYLVSDGRKGGLNDGPGKKADEMSTQLKSGEAAVMASADYSIYVELGTRKMAPQPYIRPAVALAKGAVATDVATAIAEETARGVLKAGQRRENF